ncbi:MAG: hypothetical protein HQK83_12795 [Fibrobacteria bacterium]|nr:hypothetical protein [Fibrobacteria bacterium]
MKIFKHLIILLIISSQLGFALQSRSNPVICINGHGNVAIESSLNGICEDSKRVAFENFSGVLSRQYLFGEICRDISIGLTASLSEQSKVYKHPGFAKTSQSKTISSFDRLIFIAEWRKFRVASDFTNFLLYKKTIVLLV